MAYISCYCALIFLIESSSVSQFEKSMLVKSNWLDKVNQNQVEQIKLKNHVDQIKLKTYVLSN